MDQYLSSHINDLLNNCKRRNTPQYSFFLTREEQEAVSSIVSKAKGLSCCFLPEGRNERKIFFVYPFYLEEEEAFSSLPLSLLLIRPKSEKFASSITHRDVLGALMNLGIKREAIGDIIIHEKDAYVYVLSSIQEEIERSLKQIKNNNVIVEKLDNLECPYSLQYEESTYQVASIRLDAILSEVFNLSREESKTAINKALVKMSKHVDAKADTAPKANEAISMRGKGKFIYIGENGKSKKGKTIILVKKSR